LLLILGLVPFGVGPAHATGPDYARLSLTEITPSTVTGASGDRVQIRGRLTNTFDRPISDLRVRLRLGTVLTAAVQLRTSLMAPASAFPVATPPESIATSLEPGGGVDFRLSVSIAGPDGLGISRTGVYPLLIEATGAPESTGTVWLAESRTLLPVLSLPADAQQATGGPIGTEARLGPDGSLAPDTSAPAALTMIWPLAAPPQLTAGTLGGRTEPVRLYSEALAESLQPTGRLGAQLAALENRTADEPGPDDRAREGFCLAVDPDLLVTVHGMTLGYLVSQNPADPRSATVDGTGQEAARTWMARLRSVAAKVCVTALPFAQAGLDSLASIGDSQLTSTAITGASDIVDAFLGIESLRGMSLPAVGAITETGRSVLVGQELNSSAVASSSVEPIGRDGLGRYRSGRLAVQTYDIPISAALGAAGTAPVVPSIMPTWQQPTLNGESAVSRRQTAVAALAFPMLTVPDSTGGADPTPITGRSAFIMPPTYWSPTPDDAAALFDMADLLVAAGSARPVTLRDVITRLPTTGESTPLVTPGDVDPMVAAGFPISAANAEKVRANLARTAQLEGSLVGSPDTVTTPQAYVAPLREDMLRAVATPEGQTLTQARDLQNQRLAGTGSTLTRMQDSVALLDPGGRYTLASERSPLLLIVRNELALPIRVQMDIAAPDALNVGDVGVQEIPPAGTRQIQIPTHASTSERATVQIAMASSTGLPLSAPVTLEIYTNAYGKPLFWITVGAGTLLILLIIRRLWHRFRGEADPADADRPEPDADQLRRASTPYAERLDVARLEHVDAEDS
ncbi:MAG: DUF6049 family protein, partial [Gordonia sp. (in: high G+C Gram-positive bacteria)]|uniref:DUF6049 family protein n=1 Tax=Gordonia sp. (in: high G+C Gram-positive bacteria) TaxID=84139 RepID=UPI003BB6F630